MVEPCRFHPDLQKNIETLIAKYSAGEAYSKVQHETITSLINKIDDLKEAVDKNSVMAEQRDKKLNEIYIITEKLCNDVSTVQSTVDNGLNERVDRLAKVVESLQVCVQRRREEMAKAQAELEKEFGVWKRFGLAFARNVNSLIGNNIAVLVVLLLFFILWVNFGGDGSVKEKMYQAITHLLK